MTTGKHLILTALAVLLWLSSCKDDFVSPMDGKLIREKRDLSGFTFLEVYGFNPQVHLRKGEQYSVEIECGSEYMRYVTASVKGRSLHIDNNAPYGHAGGGNEGIRCYITMPALTGIRMDGGSFHCNDTMPSDKTGILWIEGGTMHIRLNAIARDVTVRMTGNSDSNLVTLNGRGETLLVEDPYGTGASYFRGLNFPVERAVVKLNEGTAEVAFSDSLTGYTDVGNVFYRGDSARIRIKRYGQGIIQRK